MGIKRYKLNVPGDFYVEDGECIACTLPASEAPNLIGEDEAEDGYHCYFKKQPVSDKEINHAIDAMRVSCCSALRYSGTNQSIIKKIRLAGEGERIDESSTE